MALLTRFEVARLMGARALQLALGAPALIKAGKDDSVLSIAERELEKKALPLTVLRSYPNGETERLDL